MEESFRSKDHLFYFITFNCFTHFTKIMLLGFLVIKLFKTYNLKIIKYEKLVNDHH